MRAYETESMNYELKAICGNYPDQRNKDMECKGLKIYIGDISNTKASRKERRERVTEFSRIDEKKKKTLILANLIYIKQNQ